MTIARGEIYWVEFDPVKGSEQGGLRPALVIQTNVGNRFSPTTVVAAITRTIPPKPYPFVVIVEPDESGLPDRSVVNCSQVATIQSSGYVVEVSAAAGRVDPPTRRQIGRRHDGSGCRGVEVQPGGLSDARVRVRNRVRDSDNPAAWRSVFQNCRQVVDDLRPTRRVLVAILRSLAPKVLTMFKSALLSTESSSKTGTAAAPAIGGRYQCSAAANSVRIQRRRPCPRAAVPGKRPPLWCGRPARRVPITPAFWAAVTLWRPNGPASHHRRGRAWVD